MAFEDRTEEVKRLLKKAFTGALNEIGMTGASSVSANAPVDTGNLARSYKHKVDEPNLEVSIGVSDATVDYAEAVEFKPVANGGRPHLRVTLDGEKSNFKKILNDYIKEVK